MSPDAKDQRIATLEAQLAEAKHDGERLSDLRQQIEAADAEEARLEARLATAERDRDGYHGKACDIADQRDAARERLAEAERQRDALAAFKLYVHQRLDAAGIATHPDGPHSKEGCRVGDRLDLLLRDRDGWRNLANGENATWKERLAAVEKERDEIHDDLMRQRDRTGYDESAESRLAESERRAKALEVWMLDFIDSRDAHTTLAEERARMPGLLKRAEALMRHAPAPSATAEHRTDCGHGSGQYDRTCAGCVEAGERATTAKGEETVPVSDIEPIARTFGYHRQVECEPVTLAAIAQGYGDGVEAALRCCDEPTEAGTPLGARNEIKRRIRALSPKPPVTKRPRAEAAAELRQVMDSISEDLTEAACVHALCQERDPCPKHGLKAQLAEATDAAVKLNEDRVRVCNERDTAVKELADMKGAVQRWMKTAKHHQLRCLTLEKQVEKMEKQIAAREEFIRSRGEKSCAGCGYLLIGPESTKLGVCRPCRQVSAPKLLIGAELRSTLEDLKAQVNGSPLIQEAIAMLELMIQGRDVPKETPES